jgi:hypothetical protein
MHRNCTCTGLKNEHIWTGTDLKIEWFWKWEQIWKLNGFENENGFEN